MYVGNGTPSTFSKLLEKVTSLEKKKEMQQIILKYLIFIYQQNRAAYINITSTIIRVFSVL
jgi:hypothetical protein